MHSCKFHLDFCNRVAYEIIKHISIVEFLEEMKWGHSGATGNGIFFTRDIFLGFGLEGEFLVKIKIDYQSASVCIKDEFEWDISSTANK